MLAGAGSIDDLDVLRSGSVPRLIGAVRAPSTMGTFLLKFTHGHVLQLAAVNRRLLSSLSQLLPGLIGLADPVLVDMDDTIGQLHGYQQQGAAFGYFKVSLNALAVTISTHHSAPVAGQFSLRRGPLGPRDRHLSTWHGNTLTIQPAEGATGTQWNERDHEARRSRSPHGHQRRST